MKLNKGLLLKIAAMSSSLIQPTCPMRLCKIPGYMDRHNDVIYCRPSLDGISETATVFFGGDVQDFTEGMASQRDSKLLLEWNLENTAQILQVAFPNQHVIVVRPLRMEYKTFSCFENFVACSQCGAPEHSTNHNAMEHLEKLLENISARLKTMSEEELLCASQTSFEAIYRSEQNDASLCSKSSIEGNLSWNGRLMSNLSQCNINLIGFSKGCVVLNQILHELHHYKSTGLNMPAILALVKDIYWLDGGHSGGKNTWITSMSILKSFTAQNINVHIHVTPYQIDDDRRPWIKQEEKRFYDILRREGALVDRTVHFENLVPTLAQHFQLLKIFHN